MKEPFFPRGAIASFVLMLVLYVVIWFGIYSIIVGRS